MDLQVMSAWGELLGGIGGLVAALGVVVTLLYLARQVQQNTKAVQSTNLGTYLQALGEIHQSHRELSGVWSDALENRNLSPEAGWLFHGHCTQVFHAHEAVYLFYLNGTVDREYFESRMANLKLVMSVPGFKAWWQEWATDYLDSRFIQFVESEFGNIESVQLGAGSGGLVRRS